jgi:glycosyltransferase involved in cell wall biosynthesis
MKLIYTIPALNEEDWIFQTIESILKADDKSHILICVNNPDCWHNDCHLKNEQFKNNQRTLKRIEELKNPNIITFDKSSKGLGWKSSKCGVGHARNYLMSKACEMFEDNDIIVSMDADTKISADYPDGLREFFTSHKGKVALSACYYHKIDGLSPEDIRAILRYEIYLRIFVTNMLRIKSPYAFTALGSAMALTVKFYKISGGVPKRNCTEDFYFLQRLAKYGKVYNYCRGMVYPAARHSTRVPFGTGSSVASGAEKISESYPIFSYKLFDNVKTAIDLFDELYEKDVSSTVFNFLEQQLNSDNMWQSLRENFKTKDRFIHACHERLDGLRTFQYLRQTSITNQSNDEQNLVEFLQRFKDNLIDSSFNQDIEQICSIENLSLLTCDINILIKLRQILFHTEMKLRQI